MMILFSEKIDKYVYAALYTIGVVLCVVIFMNLQKPKAPAVDPSQYVTGSDPRLLGVDQAQKIGVKTCLPMLANLSSVTVEGENVATSNWNKDAPDRRAFSSLSFMRYATATAPRALGLITAVPNINGQCDGTNIRIQPSTLSCDEVAGNLAKQNIPAPEVLGDVRLYAPNPQGQRTILTPAATTGCVVVFTGTYYGK
jgi:hypothetical protein